MTVGELYWLSFPRDNIKVLDVYSGKVLCDSFNPNKHNNITSKPIQSLSVDVEIGTSYDTYRRCTYPVLRVYVWGDTDKTLDAIAKEVDGIFA